MAKFEIQLMIFSLLKVSSEALRTCYCDEHHESLHDPVLLLWARLSRQKDTFHVLMEIYDSSQLVCYFIVENRCSL